MQTRLESFIEALIGTTIGFVVAFFSSAVILEHREGKTSEV